MDHPDLDIESIDLSGSDMTPPGQIEPDAAALTIQKHWRRKNAQLNYQQDAAQEMFKALEEHGEKQGTTEEFDIRQPLVDNFLQMTASRHHIGDAINDEAGPESPLTPTPSSGLASPLSPHPAHPGSNPSFPLGVDDIVEMMEAFKAKIPLHKSYVRRILKIGQVQLNQKANIVHVTVPAGSKVTVVGDTHGQLQDLLTIFDINGMPSATNMYVFNGDFVDRGTYGCEIVITLVAMMLVYPEWVHMNRGNHEDRAMNESERYGAGSINFRGEVLDKYDNSLFHVFLRVFNALPLGHVLNNAVMVVHGGLPRDTSITIDGINELIDRHRSIPTVGNSQEDLTFCDLMWCDPRDLWPDEPTADNPEPPSALEGCVAPNPYRGCGVLWGSDMTHRFLKTNGLKMIVRSHEVEWEGYCFYHQDTVLSVFSASNYVGGGSNFGAFVQFDGAEMSYTIQQFKAPPLEEYPDLVEKRTSCLAELDDKNIAWVSELIAQHKLELYQYYSDRDQNIDGHIEQRVWASGLTEVLGLKLRWLSLRKMLYYTEHTDCEGLVNYVKFLQGYRITSSEQHGSKLVENTIEQVCTGLYDLAQSIEEAFELIDVNGNGLIEYHEFVAALRQFGPAELSESQIYDVMRVMDLNNDNCIEMYEFVKRFEVAFHKVHWATGGVLEQESDEWLKAAMSDLGKVVKKGLGKSALRQAFEGFDVNKDGQLSYEEFLRALCRVMPESYTLDQLRKLTSFVDVNHDGFIQFEEFEKSFTLMDNGSDDRNYMQCQKLVNFIWKNKAPLRTVYRLLDPGNGNVSIENLKTGLTQLNHLVVSPLSKDELQMLLDGIETDNAEMVDYNSFLDGFGVQVGS